MAPIDAIIFEGNPWFDLPAGSVRDPLARASGAVSVSYAKGFFVIIHGIAQPLEMDSAIGMKLSEQTKEALRHAVRTRLGPPLRSAAGTKRPKR